MDKHLNFTITVPQESVLVRLDVFLAGQKKDSSFKDFSRTFCQKLVGDSQVTVNGIATDRPSTLLKPDDIVGVTIPPAPALGVPKNFEGDLGVKTVFENEDFLIVNKPAGLITHEPIHGSPEVTLVDWLLTKFKEMKDVGEPDRPGIVHRLDKDTSGLMIVARNRHAHMILSDMFKNRQMHKTYWAVVKGTPKESGTIDLPIDRHPVVRNKMTHTRAGRDALTHYKLLQQFKDYAVVEAKPVTGRTHQIRVHFAAIGHSLIGDSTYGAKSKLISRQALHAYGLEFEFKGKQYSFTQEPPADMQAILKAQQ